MLSYNELKERYIGIFHIDGVVEEIEGTAMRFFEAGHLSLAYNILSARVNFLI